MSGEPSSAGSGTGSGSVRVDVVDAVATVTLARPSAMNALDTATKVALRDAVEQLADDDGIRCVVLTGEGRAFCVGQDLREHVALLESLPVAEVWATVREHYLPIATALATMAKPVVAAVNGIAAGAGAALAFAADVRIVADTAGFNLAFSSIGLSCDTGTSWTLPRLVGHAKAMELLMFPRTVGADEALTLGLATSVSAPADLLHDAASLAARLASGPTLAFGAIRRALSFAGAHTLSESMDYEAELMALTGSSEDHRRAVAAFLVKQPPHFTGR